MPLVAAAAAGPANRRASIASVLVASIDSRIDGLTPATAKPLFVNYASSQPTNARNGDCWASDIADITAISAWNSVGDNFYGGLLIARDVIAHNVHADLPIGTVWDFIDADGNRVQGTSVARGRIGVTDIHLSRLSSPVAAGIAHAKVLAEANYATVQTAVNGGLRVPVLYSSLDNKALVSDSSTQAASAGFQIPEDAARFGFYENLGEGSSGRPACWVYNSQLIALTTFHFGGSGSGDSFHYHRAAINAKMTEIGSAYQLTEITI